MTEDCSGPTVTSSIPQLADLSGLALDTFAVASQGRRFGSALPAFFRDQTPPSPVDEDTSTRATSSARLASATSRTTSSPVPFHLASPWPQAER